METHHDNQVYKEHRRQRNRKDKIPYYYLYLV